MEILCDCSIPINAKIAAHCGSPKERKANVGKAKSVSKYSAHIVSQAHYSQQDNRNMALPSKLDIPVTENCKQPLFLVFFISFIC